MQTPISFWMNAWASGWGLMQTGIKTTETMTASKDIIESRTQKIADAVRNPLKGDYVELARMIPEKVAAFSLSAKATAEDLRAIHKDLSANKRLMEEIASGRRVLMPWDMMAFFTRAANLTTRTMAISGNALAPIHRRAVANQKRLKRAR